MALLKQLLSQQFCQQPRDELLTILILGSRKEHQAMTRIQLAVEQAITELGVEQISNCDSTAPDPEVGSYLDYNCSIVEVDWQAIAEAGLAEWANQHLLVSSAGRVLLLPLLDCSVLLAGLTPAKWAALISQFLQTVETLPHLNLCPILLTQASAPCLAATRLVASALKQNGHGSIIGIDRSSDDDKADTRVNTDLDSEAEEPHVQLVERWGPMVVAVLAAGKSSRMGRSKQLEPVNGVPMVVQAVTTAIRAGADKVILVTGAYADDVNALLSDMSLAGHPSIQIIHNPQFGDGQSTSVRAVIRHLWQREHACPAEQTSCDEALMNPDEYAIPVAAITFMPVDQPFLSPLTLTHLFRLWQTGIQIVTPSVQGIPRGAPALFDQQFWPHLASITGDVGAKPLLRRFGDQLRTVEVAEQQLVDIDTPAALP